MIKFGDRSFAPSKIVFICLFLVLSGGDFFLNLQGSSFVQIYDTIPDEIYFFDQANLLADLILNKDVNGISKFGVPYGYGFLFWLTSATLIVLSPFQTSATLVFLKIIFLSFKWISLSFLLQTLLKRSGINNCLLFLLSFSSCSIFFFFGKIFSPEFLILLLSSWAVFLLAKDDFCYTRSVPFALFLAALSTTIKSISFPSLLMCFLYLIYGVRRGSLSWQTTSHCFIGVLLAFIIGHINLLSSEALNNMALWLKVNTNRSFGIEYVSTWILLRTTTWDFIAISGAVGLLGCIPALAFFFLSLKYYRSLPYFYFSLICVVSGAIGIGVVIIFNGYLDWYIQLPVILFLYGCYFSFQLKDKILLIFFAASVFILILSTDETIRRINVRNYVLSELAKSQHFNNSVFYPFFGSTNFAENSVILTDFLIGFDSNAAPLQIYRVRDALTHIYEQNRGATQFADTDRRNFDFSKVQYILLNEDLIFKNASPLLNFGIVQRYGNEFKFGSNDFVPMLKLDGRTLLLKK